MTKPIVVFNVGWMREYQGLSDDTITGGGSWVDEHKFGHEVFNFEPYLGKMYGYVQPPSGGTLNVDRLGASPDDISASGVLVVWVACRRPGTYIVGWYDDAVVYREIRQPPGGATLRVFKGESVGYIVRAKASQSVLLPEDDRTFLLPRGEKGQLSRNVWYPDRPEHSTMRKEILDYVGSRKLAARLQPGTKKKGQPFQPDTVKRIKVEKAAIGVVAQHYEGKGYSIESVENEYRGWDLEASLGKTTLLLEVKGLSGNHLSTELTPNELKQMGSHKKDYRVCVVLQALEKPDLRVYSYNPTTRNWQDGLDRVLVVSTIKFARLTSE